MHAQASMTVSIRLALYFESPHPRAGPLSTIQLVRFRTLVEEGAIWAGFSRSL